MSPILTRPVREQLEHDRVIRLLQARYKRKNEVIINPGNEQNQSIQVGDLVVFPDLLVLAEDGRRLLATVEVETGESVNAIEARAEWGVYSKVKVPLHLYVPPTYVDAVKRLCAEYQIQVTELWTYTTNYDQVRFNMVFRSPDAPNAKVIIKPTVKLPPPPPPEPKIDLKPMLAAIAARPPSPLAPRLTGKAAKDIAKLTPKPVAVPVAKDVTPVKAPVPAKPVAPVKVAAPVKAAEKVAAKPVAKTVAKAAAKPVAKAAAKPAAKPVAKAKPVVKAKPAPKSKPAAKAKPKAKASAKPTKPAAKKPAASKAKPKAKGGKKRR